MSALRHSPLADRTTVSRAGDGPWDGVHIDGRVRFMAANCIFDLRSANAATKRQPAGTGQHSHGAFGFAPCDGRSPQKVPVQ
jgi:hypothetical protein